MARILSQTLIRDPSSSFLLSSARSHLRCRFVSSRARYSRADKAHLVEIDLAGESDAGGGEVEVHMGIRKLEDAIHRIIVRRLEPDWLPFVPGSSYWVPPKGKRAVGLVEVVGMLANPLTEEETLSLRTTRGWPSSAYFVEGVSPHPAKKKNPPRKAASLSDDEE